MKRNLGFAVWVILVLLAFGAPAAEITPGEAGAVSQAYSVTPERLAGTSFLQEGTDSLKSGKPYVALKKVEPYDDEDQLINVAKIEIVATSGNPTTSQGRTYPRRIYFSPKNAYGSPMKYKNVAEIFLPFSMLGGRQNYYTIAHFENDAAQTPDEVFSNDPSVIGADPLSVLEDGVRFTTHKGFSYYAVKSSNQPEAAASADALPRTGESGLPPVLLFVILGISFAALVIFRGRKTER